MLCSQWPLALAKPGSKGLKPRPSQCLCNPAAAPVGKEAFAPGGESGVGSRRIRLTGSNWSPTGLVNWILLFMHRRNGGGGGSVWIYCSKRTKCSQVLCLMSMSCSHMSINYV